MRREYSCSNFNEYLEDPFSQSQRNFYPQSKQKYLNTEPEENNLPSAPKILIKSNDQNFHMISEEPEDKIYVEDLNNSLNYIGRPYINQKVLIGYKIFYEFTCFENNKKYFAKRYNKFDKQNLIKEKNILRNLKHDNILSFIKTIEDEDYYYILYEKYEFMFLNEYLTQRKKLTEKEVKYIMLKLINLLKYLKSNNIILRNLHLNNILLTSKGEIKVIGFESAIRLESNQKKIKQEIDFWKYILAPEVWNNNTDLWSKYTVEYSYEIDIWALGSIMYELLVGIYPSIDYNTDMKSFSKSIPNISKRAQDCIRRLLEPYPSKRQKLNQILMLDFFYY